MTVESRVPRPSLNALRAFEATARLRSFGDAADELSVTHGAVSRHIRALEDNLGVPLLVRNAHATDPTPEGARLAEGLSRAFRLIQESVEQVKPGPLTLSCSASIMMYWLLPRLAILHQQHPKLEVSFDTGSGEVDFSRDKVGVAIRLSSIKPPRDVVPLALMDEWIGPVCSPEYLRAVPMRAPAEIVHARLLATKTRPEAWRDWIDTVLTCPGGVSDTDTDTDTNNDAGTSVAESFEHFYLLIQAAKCGLGLANVPRMLVRDELRSGALVAPFGFVQGPQSLVLWVAPHLAERAQTQALVGWIKTQMQAAFNAPV